MPDDPGAWLVQFDLGLSWSNIQLIVTYLQGQALSWQDIAAHV